MATLTDADLRERRRGSGGRPCHRTDAPQTVVILAALWDGPGTSLELAAETGIPKGSVAAALSALKKTGDAYVIGGRGTKNDPLIWSAHYTPNARVNPPTRPEPRHG